MENKDWWVKYAPLIFVVFAFFMQYHCFVTPQELGKTKTDILLYMAKNYATKEQNADLKNQLNDMQHKIDRIYDIMTKR